MNKYNILKVLKITAVNIFLIIIGAVILEAGALWVYYNEYKGNMKAEYGNSAEKNTESFLSWAFHSIVFFKSGYFDVNDFRKSSGLKFKKPPIILAGCSFTYGDRLNYNETFSYILSKYTKHPVYNLGLGGTSPRTALYILRNKSLRNKLLKSAENIKYVIYTYIPDQLPRLYADVYRKPEPMFFYNKSENKLKYFNSKGTIFRSYSYYLISRKIAYSMDTNKQFKLFQIYMNEISKEIKKISTGAKLVILAYDTYITPAENFLDGDIIIINVSDIVKENLRDDKFRTIDHHHPSAEAWKIIVPKLAEKLEL